MTRFTLFVGAAALISSFSMTTFAQEEGDTEPVQQPSVGSIKIQSFGTGDGEGGQIVVANSFSTSPMGGAPDIMSLLQNPGVRKEIELVDDQYAKMKNINAEIQKRMQSQIKSLFSDGKLNIENPKDLVKKIEEARTGAEEEVKKMLLPHQIERLKQVAFHAEMKQKGTFEALTDGKLAELLEITDEQKKALKETSKEIEEDVAKAIAKIRADAKKKLYKELTKTQQKKLDEVLGADFDYKEVDWRKSLGKQIKGMRRPSKGSSFEFKTQKQ